MLETSPFRIGVGGKYAEQGLYCDLGFHSKVKTNW